MDLAALESASLVGPGRLAEAGPRPCRSTAASPGETASKRRYRLEARPELAAGRAPLLLLVWQHTAVGMGAESAALWAGGCSGSSTSPRRGHV